MCDGRTAVVRRYYKDSWDTISKAEKYRSSGGSEEMQLKLGGTQEYPIRI